MILTDDVGFGASSTFGGPIQTPNFQRLADSGLRYNMFHTTALCSPTRAALITGRNHQSVASGSITEFATGYPGYDLLVPKSAGSIGAVLKDNGYNTAWFGKMHNVPDWMSIWRTKRLRGCECSTRSHPISLGCCTTRPARHMRRITRPKIG